MEWMFIFFVLCSMIAIFFIFFNRKVYNETNHVDQLLKTYKEEIQKQKNLLLKQQKEINRIERKIATKKK